MTAIDARLTRMEALVDLMDRRVGELLGVDSPEGSAAAHQEPVTLAPVIPLFRKAAG